MAHQPRIQRTSPKPQRDGSRQDRTARQHWEGRMLGSQPDHDKNDDDRLLHVEALDYVKERGRRQQQHCGRPRKALAVAQTPRGQQQGERDEDQGDRRRARDDKRQHLEQFLKSTPRRARNRRQQSQQANQSHAVCR